MKLFYSYCHKDEEYRYELEKHLSILKDQGFLDEWHDRRISAGNHVQDEIEQHFNSSDIILLMMSPDFLFSEECKKEMNNALLRRSKEPLSVTVVPVILRRCAWKDSAISNLLAVPRDGKPVSTWTDKDEAFVDIYEKLKEIIEKSRIRIRNEYLTEIDQVEFISQRKDDIKLGDIFVFPNIENAFGQGEIKRLGQLWEKKNCAIVRGDDRSGRTVLCRKLFLEEHKKGSAVVMLSGSDIINRTNHNSIIEMKFHEQFNGPFRRWETNDRKILIVDDLSRDVHLSFIEFAKSYFDHVLLTVSTDEYLVYFRDEECFADFEMLRLRSFGHAKQESLVKKWLSLHNGQAHERAITHGKIDAIEDRLNSIILHNRIVPRYPFYILSILQTFEGFMPQGLRITNYGHCYQALIIAQLVRARISETDVDSALNFLSHLSYHLFVGGGSCTSSELRTYVKQYKTLFVVKDSTINRLRRDDSLILKNNDDGHYRFKYSFVYFFFLGMYFSENYDAHSHEIERLATDSYLNDNAYILTFAIHHTRDNDLIDTILLHTASAIDHVSPSRLDVSEMGLLEDALDEVPERIMSETVEQGRRSERDARDRHESRDEHVIHERSEEEDFNDVYRALKNMDIIGQVLKNKYGSLPREKISEMVEFVVDAGLRLVGWITNRETVLGLEKYLCRLLDESQLSERQKIKIESFLKKQIRLLVLVSMNALLRKIVISLRKPELRDVIVNVCRQGKTPAHDLLSVVFLAASSTDLSDKFVGKLKDTLSALDATNNSVVRRLLSLEIQGYLSTHTVDYQLRHRIFSLLGIKYRPNPSSFR